MGYGRSGDINRRPVLALILLLARFRQGAVGDRSLVRPSAVGEPCPSSARRGPASTEPGLRVAWQTRVVWLSLLLATDRGASLLSLADCDVFRGLRRPARQEPPSAIPMVVVRLPRSAYPSNLSLFSTWGDIRAHPLSEPGLPLELLS